MRSFASKPVLNCNQIKGGGGGGGGAKTSYKCEYQPETFRAISSELFIRVLKRCNEFHSLIRRVYTRNKISLQTTCRQLLVARISLTDYRESYFHFVIRNLVNTEANLSKELVQARIWRLTGSQIRNTLSHIDDGSLQNNCYESRSNVFS